MAWTGRVLYLNTLQTPHDTFLLTVYGLYLLRRYSSFEYCIAWTRVLVLSDFPLLPRDSFLLSMALACGLCDLCPWLVVAGLWPIAQSAFVVGCLCNSTLQVVECWCMVYKFPCDMNPVYILPKRLLSTWRHVHSSSVRCRPSYHPLSPSAVHRVTCVLLYCTHV